MTAYSYIYFLMLHFSAGCIIKDERPTKTISGYTGGSVLLPCSCAQTQSTVNTFSWEFQRTDEQWIQVLEEKKYRGRLVLFNESSPTNLSLLISGLREEDAGFYSCRTILLNSYTYVQLKVKEKPHIHLTSLSTYRPSYQTQALPPFQQAHHTPQYGFILVAVFTSVLLLLFLALSTRCAKNEVPYVAVVYVETASKPAHTQNDPAELTEYVNTSATQT